MITEDQTSYRYTTELSKGQGAVSETVTLLRLWETGMEPDELASRALEARVLGKATEVRSRDLVRRVFVRRYFVDQERPAKVLKTFVERNVELNVLKQFMLLFTARVHPILHDFIAEVYWPRYAAGSTRVSRIDAEAFIDRATARGDIDPPWSDIMKVRVARYLTGTLADFGYLREGRASAKEILPYRLLPATTLYLAQEIHFDGYSDASIPAHPDWRLFGLAREDVVQHLERCARDGHFIVQHGGEVLRIAWTYQTLEDCVDAITG